MNNIFRTGAKASLILLSSALFASCGQDTQDPGLEYAPDMYYPVSYEPLKQLEGNNNAINPGGLNMRVPAANTIARGKLGFYTHISKDSAEVAGRELSNPLRANQKNLEEGKVLYLRFCSPCHGDSGTGDGLVGAKFKGVPNYTQGRYAALPAGHIYHVIVNGRGRMMPHGTQVNPEERWKIVMYVQQLQKGKVDVEADTEADTGSLVQDAPNGPSTNANSNEVTGTTVHPTKDIRSN
ncbi:c-type cytochrome [Rufibacter quisquiliarum]|uniref:Mono/diheme cytochrome c family protein n=1 Tax=Rufibacter quisquiliarum TaxID=1549639 RepID=A0A839GK25_9BACT|nr:cytochrome c [Rufibacter quisquiliarum]MBA9079010.1 mono/diheme cytochrome c family protein [Rufibacter quisquiliarum]